MSKTEESLNQLRKLESITQRAPRNFSTEDIPFDQTIIESINTLEITENKKLIAHALLAPNKENKIVIQRKENYEAAKELIGLYQEKAPELGSWGIYFNKKGLKIVKLD